MKCLLCWEHIPGAWLAADGFGESDGMRRTLAKQYSTRGKFSQCKWCSSEGKGILEARSQELPQSHSPQKTPHTRVLLGKTQKAAASARERNRRELSSRQALYSVSLGSCGLILGFFSVRQTFAACIWRGWLWP